MELMVDLETLSTSCNAVFKSIGWAVFSRTQRTVLHSGTIQVDPQSCIDLGMDVDWSTVKWWLEQSEEARAEMLHKGDRLDEALMKLRFICLENSIKEVWSRGQDFDLAILRMAYRNCKIKLPWKFWDGRDLRTALDLLDFDKRTIVRSPDLKPHVAGDDAIFQAKCLLAALASK